MVSRFPCLRGRGPPREETRLACIPITAFRLSPASTLRAAPHAIDRHSYRNAYADCSSSWWPHPAPASAASLRPPSSRPAGRHADLIGLEAAFRRARQWPDQDTGRSAAALRTGPPWCRKPVLQPLANFSPEQQTAAREQPLPAQRLPVPALCASRPGSCPEAPAADSSQGLVIHGSGGQVPVHAASDDRGSSSSSAELRSGGTDCQPGAATDRTCVLLPARGLRSSPCFRTGRSPPATCPQLCLSGRPSLCRLVTGTGVLCLWWTPSGRLRPPPGIHVGKDTAPSRSRGQARIRLAKRRGIVMVAIFMLY